ncbi:dynamin family protein [Streptococcus entericus]|uniref:dynamin family protein n=1 Tax=Streptococcus entericus TaxID=155680 RepID=UPI00035C6817|nr:dynamin family protein [Streptococcus entericus]
MVQLKIISHPYEKQITFQKWEEEQQVWENITYQQNSNSQLISEQIKTAFFPFKVREIVDILITEYDDGQEIELIFEGTAEEFEELHTLIKHHSHEASLNLTKSSLRLQNARTILPRVITIFEGVKQLITTDEVVNRDIMQFKEAASDVIPVVVLGNYSVGKSSLINALIGEDLLPSSDSPATAKIIDIRPSDKEDVWELAFELNQEPIKLSYKRDQFIFTEGSERIEADFPELKEMVFSTHSNSPKQVFQRFLSYLNEAPQTDERHISELVQVRIPITQGVLGQPDHRFAIFDTPGSNSSSNQNHLEVLKQAMSNMSNGVILFVTDYTSLDALDNMALYRELSQQVDIDTRFTILVVNKADQIDFSDFDETKVLSQALPKQLYSQGLYFVSPVMGLGHKTAGQFTDYTYDRIFKKSLDEFTNPTSPYYQELYRYMIVPEQLKKAKIEQAKQVTTDALLFANSGLLSLEQELDTFARYYSPYNKCQQAKLYLEKTILTTEQNITHLTEELEEEANRLADKLESEKNDLINRTTRKGKQQLMDLLDVHHSSLQALLSSPNITLTAEKLADLCEQEYQNKKKSAGLEQFRKDKDQNWKNLQHHFSNLGSHIKSALDERDITILKQTFDQIQEDTKESFKGSEAYGKKKRQIFEEVSQSLLNDAQAIFDKDWQETRQLLFSKSAQELEQACLNLKQRLAFEIGLTDTLPFDKREEIKELILSHETLQLKHHIRFDKEKVVQGFKLGDVHLFGNPYKLDLDKLVKLYHHTLLKETRLFFDTLVRDHQQTIQHWLEQLLTLINSHITEFNPKLRETHQLLIDKQECIAHYEAVLRQLKNYSEELISLMSFENRRQGEI